MIDQSIWEGVHALLDDYASIRDGDVAVLAYTPDSRQCAAWVSVALETRGIAVSVLPMAPFGDPSFAPRLAAVLPAPAQLAGGRVVVMTFELDTISHTDVFRSALSVYDPQQRLVIRALGACPELFSQALRIAPGELSALNTAVLERCMPARSLRVTAPNGTDLQIRLDPERSGWTSIRGTSRPGSFTVIPAGEVATLPASVDGTIVADFAFHVNVVTSLDVRLHDHPVTLTVKDGKAVDFHCSDADVSRYLDEFFAIEGLRGVNELGFGTNKAVLSGTRRNSHINERKAGVHLGFGRTDDAGAVHLDLVTGSGLLWVDDDPTPLDLANLVPSTGEHPANLQDEDAF
jgi:leucyl aminopeptidase (aminopeptidase T)